MYPKNWQTQILIHKEQFDPWLVEAWFRLKVALEDIDAHVYNIQSLDVGTLSS